MVVHANENQTSPSGEPEVSPAPAGRYGFRFFAFLALLAAPGFFVKDRLVLLVELLDFAAARGTLGFLSSVPATPAAALLAASAARLATSLTLWAAPVISVLAISEPPP
jgi:hypothetical protein